MIDRLSRLLLEATQAALRPIGWQLRRSRVRSEFRRIPDHQFYAGLFSPWKGYGEFGSLHREVRAHTLVSDDRCYVLHALARQAIGLGGEFWECGVYRGGTALLLQRVAERDRSLRVLRLFDTFEGMPATRPDKDLHREGDFADTTLARVQSLLGLREATIFHKGQIPETFRGLEDRRIAFAHVDVDIHDAVRECPLARQYLVTSCAIADVRPRARARGAA